MSTPLVRSSDIATMANVSRAAVTQWRKRHADFPTPKQDGDSDSPLFDRTEVEQWLARRGRNIRNSVAHSSSPEAVGRSIVDHLRGTGISESSGVDLAGSALVMEYLARGLDADTNFEGAAVGLRDHLEAADIRTPGSFAGLSSDEIRQWARAAADSSAELAMALEPVAELGTEQGQLFLSTLHEGIRALPVKVFLSVYDEVIGSDRRNTFLAPPELSGFLTKLSERECGTVLDPVVGPGGTLLAIGENRALNLVGVDRDRGSIATALRRAVLANRAIDLRVGNSIGADPASDVQADIVVSTPPWGIRSFDEDIDPHDPRWVFGRPSPRSEGIWLQHAIGHLADGGRAFVVTPISELTKTGPSEALRQELLRRGAVEAVISLPGGIFHPYTRIAAAVWVLSKPGKSVDPDRVLLIRATPGDDRDVSSLSEVAEQYRQWNQGRDVDDSENSLVVSVRDLLKPGADLLPEIWLARRDAPSPQQFVDKIRDTYELVAGRNLPVVEQAVDFAAADTVRKERLSTLHGVTVHRGLSKDITEGPVPLAGVPVLSGRVLNEYAETGAAEATSYILHSSLDDAPLTRAGDIVVNAVSRRPPAMRFDLDGWAVASSVFLIRIDPDSGIDPDYLVTVINAQARVQSDTVAGIPRMTPSRLEIPVIPIADQHRISQALRDMDTVAAEMDQQRERMRDLSRLLEDAAAAGALTTPNT